MQDTDIPIKIAVPFAVSAGTDYIRTVPVPSQIGIDDGAASFTDGFPPLTFIPEAGGGFPPDGRDFNGLLSLFSNWLRWYNAGGPIGFDSAFRTAVGGYPSGAMINSTTAGKFWISSVDNNTNNPDITSTGWATLSSYVLASPAITGTGTAATQPVNTSNTSIATTFYADRSATNAANAVLSTAEAYTNAQLAFYLPLTGGTLTGSLSVGDGSTAATEFINGAAGTIRTLRWQTAGGNRMALQLGSDAEGVGTGSTPGLYVYDNTSTLRGAIFTLDRFNVIMNFTNAPTVPNGTYPASGSNPTGVPNFTYVDNIPGFGSGAAGGRSYHTVASGGFGTNRVNTRAFDIFVSVSCISSVANDNLQATVAGALIANHGQVGVSSEICIGFFVPAGATYKPALQIGSASLIAWYEYF